MRSDDPRVLKALLRKDLCSFIERTAEIVSPGAAYQPNWHVDAIAASLTECLAGRCPRLIITMPPRCLKSVSVSVAFPAFVLGRDPTKRIIAASYSNDLSGKHSRDCRILMQSAQYRSLFPGTQIDPRKNTELEFATTRGGSRLSTSVGGTLTGRGGDILIGDDLLKAADASSAAARKSTNEWLRSTFMTRLDDKLNGIMILVMHRLHVEDPVGVLLDTGEWSHLNLPAIAEYDQEIPLTFGRTHRRRAGDVLHPLRESRAVLEQMRRDMGTANFEAQYQQNPVPAGGGMIKTAWFATYVQPPAQEAGDLIVISWDTAMKSHELADFSVALVFRVRKGVSYLLEVVRERLEYPDLRRRALQLAQRYPGSTTLVEDQGSGTGLAQELRRDGVRTVPIKPIGDKVMRMRLQLAAIEGGLVHLPAGAPWREDFLQETAAFPNGAHDDQVDALSQALGWITERSRRRGPISVSSNLY